jgi:hypothetical protein
MPRPTLSRLLVSCVALVVALGLTGCAHYQLGSGGKLAFSRLYVAPVRDDAALPQAAVLVTSQLRERILRDGRVQLVDSPDAAEAILEVTLTRYERGVATVRPNDTGLARKLELALEAEATLRSTATNIDWFSRRPLMVRRQAFTDMPEGSETFGNQGQAERQTFVLVATAIAEAATAAALDVW